MSTTCVDTLTVSAGGIASALEQYAMSPFRGCTSRRFIVKFNHVKFDDVEFLLNHDLEFTLEELIDGWACEQREFSLFSFARTNKEAVYSCFEDFAVLWEEIAQSPDDALSGDAKKMKQELLVLVKSATHQK